MKGEVIKFKDRKPSLPYRWRGVRLEFYVRYPQGDIVEIVEDEEIIKEYAYIVYFLPWRKEFEQRAEYDEEGEIIVEDYVNKNFDKLLAEAKKI